MRKSATIFVVDTGISMRNPPRLETGTATNGTTTDTTTTNSPVDYSHKLVDENEKGEKGGKRPPVSKLSLAIDAIRRIIHPKVMAGKKSDLVGIVLVGTEGTSFSLRMLSMCIYASLSVESVSLHALVVVVRVLLDALTVLVETRNPLASDDGESGYQRVTLLRELLPPTAAVLRFLPAAVEPSNVTGDCRCFGVWPEGGWERNPSHIHPPCLRLTERHVTSPVSHTLHPLTSLTPVTPVPTHPLLPARHRRNRGGRGSYHQHLQEAQV